MYVPLLLLSVHLGFWGDFTCEWVHAVFVLLSLNLFQWAQYLPGLSMLCCKWQNFHSYLWLSSIPFFIHTYTTYSSSIYLLIDIWIASISWLLQAMPLWTLGYIYLFKLVFLFSLDIYVGVGWLSLMVVVVFWGTSILFSTRAAPVYIFTSNVQRFFFLCIFEHFCYLWLFWW